MRNQTLMSRQLEYFCTLYRLKNYQAAAKAIPITYQGLKKSISKLETELNAALFASDKEDKLTPTLAADLLYEQAIQWTEDINRLEDSIQSRTANSIRTLSVCAARGAMNTLSYEMFFDFDELNPDIRLDINELSDVCADESLLHGEFGIGFTASPFEENLVTIPLVSQSCAAWVHKDHPLALRQSISLSDLDGENVMMPSVQYKETHYILSALNERGIHLAAKRFNSDPSWSMAYAAQNRGIGLTPANVYGFASSTSDAVLISIIDGYNRTTGISHRRGHILSADERKLWNYITNKASRQERPSNQ